MTSHEEKDMPNTPKWWVRGDWFDVCSCNIPCPCEFAQAPTDNRCEGVLAWHLREGEYGDVRLDGLNVLAVGGFTDNVWEGAQTARIGMFVDERADERQREAIGLIFSGQVGGWMAEYGKIICEMRGVEYAPISFEVADDLAYWRAHIPGRVDALGTALTGPTMAEGTRCQMYNLPGSEVGPPDGPATWGSATRNTVSAFGYTWDWAGKSSKHIPFHWSGP